MIPKEKQQEFYSGWRILSYGTSWIFVIGNRTAGKSFFWKEYAVNRFIKHGEQFVYIRRYKNDLKKVVKNFFNDIGFKFKDHKLQVKGREFYVDDKLAGFAIALTEGEQNKSNSLPDVKLMIFDEFLNKKEKYIGGRSGVQEVEDCLDLYMTIARGGGKYVRDDVRFVFISNAMSIINPYFLYFGIEKRIKKGMKILTQEGGRKGWALELYVNEQAKDAVLNSKLGDLIEGTNYAEMALNNEFFLDDSEFIEKAPAGCRYQCTLRYAEKTFGLWLDRTSSVFYVNEKYDPSCKIVYSLDIDSHTVNTVYANRSSTFFKTLKKAYEGGQIRFNSQLAKNAILIYLKLS